MSVARSYAKALYEAAVEAKSPSEAESVCNQIETHLKDVVALVASSKEAQVALYGPVTTSREKTEIVREIAKRAALHPMMSQFLALLAMKDRLVLLPELRETFSVVRLEAEGGVRGQLVSAEPMSEEDISSLARAFTKKLGKKVSFNVSTDPSLLAGMSVTVNGTTYDGSLKSQLTQLRDRFVMGLSIQ